MADRIVSFVMSGGVGSRLWPLSRDDNPKQFHDLSGDGSMLVKTLRRLGARPAGETPIYLIASERHAERVRSDIAALDLHGGRPLFEPAGRNTAAAVALATLQTIDAHGKDALVLVVPSDHEISTERQFWSTVEAGVPAAQAGRLVVFGIRPSQPETGYGYIKVADAGAAVCSHVPSRMRVPSTAAPSRAGMNSNDMPRYKSAAFLCVRASDWATASGALEISEAAPLVTSLTWFSAASYPSLKR